ncbi:MAG TPA: hypothetical protein VD838_21620 [Anaeromyxobacteraceae bacterium]|nr:hypothetical protein [Anaeromyxobacteraceae bacterium]
MIVDHALRAGASVTALAAVVALAVPGTAAAHVAFCPELWNPHGQTTPPAGSTTLPGAAGGQNEDGFYQVIACSDVNDLVCPIPADNPVFAEPCYCEDDTEIPVLLFDGCGDGGGGTGFQYDGDPSTPCDQTTGVGCDPFQPGTVVKFTESGIFNQAPMAGGSESSDAVDWHLWGTGDLLVVSASEDPASYCCHVPEPPK